MARGLHLIVGLAFLISGWSKAGHPPLFVSHLIYRLDWFPDALAWPFTMALATAELLLGAMLIAPFRAPLARKIAALLLTLFVFYLLLITILGQNLPCQCYGSLIEFHPLLAMGLDILLLLILYLLEQNPSPSQTRIRPFLAICTCLALLLTLTHTTTVFDPLLVQLKSGEQLPVLPSLHPLAINRDSTRLVIIAKEPPTPAALKELEAEYPQTQILVLLPQITQAYRLGNATALPMKADMVASFAKTFPTSFSLKDQQVRHIWWGRLPPIP